MMVKRWLAIGVLAVLLVGAAMAATLPQGSGSASETYPFHRFAPAVAADSAGGSEQGLPNSVAGRLVAEVNSAGTSAERVIALQHVFGALGVGVYDANGNALVSGAESSSNDFYLYSPELETMAASIGRGDRWSFDDLANLLNASAILDTTISASDLRNAVDKAVAEANGHASESDWLAPLLVGQLDATHAAPGLLIDSTATSTPALDALQRAIILSDLLIELPRSSALTASSSRLLESSRGVLQAASPAVQAECGEFQGSQAARNLGKFAAGFIEAAGKVIQVVTLPLDVFHGASLALGVKVEALDDNLQTHFGHETPGKPLAFPVRVRMLDQLTETQINCGWMVGLTFPKQGPIPNVKVSWDTGDLESLGKVTCGVACQQTGDDGVATLNFQPNNEQAPYDGPLTSEKGRVEADAQYLSSLGNMFGPVNDVVTPKMADFVWEVGWHAKGTWEGEITMTYSDPNGTAKGTSNVRFELGLPSPGEGDTHTNVYELTQGTMVWTDNWGTCTPVSGTTQLPRGTSLTVTDTNGSRTYSFHGVPALVPITLHCGSSTISQHAIAPDFPFPLNSGGQPDYVSGPGTVGDTISGTATFNKIGNQVITWTWTLHRK